MYDLVGHPVDRFSNDVAQVITAHPIKIIYIMSLAPKLMKLFSCSTHLSVKYIMVINARVLIIVVI